MLSPAGFSPEKGCAGVAQQLKTTDPTSRQREHPTSTNTETKGEKEKLFAVPDGSLTARQTGRVTVGRNVT
jgi:hypothetical protein